MMVPLPKMAFLFSVLSVYFYRLLANAQNLAHPSYALRTDSFTLSARAYYSLGFEIPTRMAANSRHLSTGGSTQ